MQTPAQGNKATVNLKDYAPPCFLIKETALHVDIGQTDVRVRTTSQIVRRGAAGAALVLDGQDMTLVSLAINGRQLGEDEYRLSAERLIIDEVGDDFTLEVETLLRPDLNTSLTGMYQSSGNICTQCEAEGFRRITYFVDRPDNMTIFTTTIVADKQRYPVLLSNGNWAGHGVCDDGRHWVKWHDPFPKPSYLFALVAGDLACVSGAYVTRSGRHVDLHIYVQHHNATQCGHALLSLINAMKWDEEVYGREYDLDVFNIVAVDDFNMGAMENKGLNIFNSKYVLANAETATDSDYQAIEGIIGHEYFHNWSGNRVTCRDWFQLSLKEGFTVFRDQEFSADMASRAVKRIQDVNVLRNAQFREDASPVAHPVQPASYMEINNFYTATVYNKGAEVVRMLYNLLGKETFRKGTDLYFTRHDGQAVTIDDFVAAMAEVSGEDLRQFKRWYSQAGTPVVKVTSSYDDAAQRYTLTFAQSCPPTPEAQEKAPFHIPIAMALLDKDGNASHQGVLALREAQQTFVFDNIVSKPAPSLLRGFSAPIKLETDLSNDDLYFLMAKDGDFYNRWDAAQRLGVQLILANVQRARAQQPLRVDDAYLAALANVLIDRDMDKSFQSLLLVLPSEAYIAEFMAIIDPLAIHQAARFVKTTLAEQFKATFIELYHAHHDTGDYNISAEAIGRRSLKNLCLSYLNELNDEVGRELAWQQFSTANNMTDVMAAFNTLSQSDSDYRAQAIDQFYARWCEETQVLDKWFQVQAMSRLPGGVERVRALLEHDKFSLKNPNKVRALIGAFSQGNPANFHQADGAGYALLGDCIVELDEINPQIAARLLSSFGLWKRYDAQRQTQMKTQLERVIARPNVSRDSYDVAQRLLA